METGFFERTAILIHQEGMDKLAQLHVLVCGLGGVGSYAAEALCRAGVGHLTLVEHDTIAASNINRQLHATHATVGQKKMQVMLQRMQQINPHGQIDPLDQFLTREQIPDLLETAKPHVVLDAIDSLNCKVGLIVESYHRGIPVFSSMGAGGRLDPTKVQVSDLMQSHTCPLASKVRQRCRREGVRNGVICAWSSEIPAPPLPPEPVTQGRPRAVNGTISYLPALFGLLLAGRMIHQQLNPLAPPAP
ncbi:UBA/THIF-type NAD/FAD binding protein [Magnetococcus marinus MC-1]|uniref:UBA/THIF-type NAD/FAD binding protein n=1 Tax=Magnetococcus marinus (strain ATCC BAA-1437 / JCM 17883 / MC-1) TaxID=156889 RepID=A0L6L1_MAGMM|nr:tRNA threonylcarbamoyladenosine dehydratase [Magnetococcus marinus]ABK43604.1 UBA/THIF-type NAD/FAD binding protein [Magnetococcus marinus MC-1]